MPSKPARARWATAAWAALAAACAADQDVDPRVLAARHEALHAAAADERVLPVSAPVAGRSAPGTAAIAAAAPAPIGEIYRRPEPARLLLAIALGHRAAHAFGDAGGHAMRAGTGDDHEFVVCSDREATDLVLLGRAPFAVIGGELSARERDTGLVATPFAAELFGLAVPPASPYRSLTRQQVRQILTGQVQDWQQIGGAAGPIAVWVPADRQLAERAARALVPGDALAADCRRYDTAPDLATRLAADQDAIAVVGIDATSPATGRRLLAIDWSPPGIETFRHGAYPFGNLLQVVTRGAPGEPARRFLTFVRSPSGRAALGPAFLVLP